MRLFKLITLTVVLLVTGCASTSSVTTDTPLARDGYDDLCISLDEVWLSRMKTVSEVEDYIFSSLACNKAFSLQFMRPDIRSEIAQKWYFDVGFTSDTLAVIQDEIATRSEGRYKLVVSEKDKFPLIRTPAKKYYTALVDSRGSEELLVMFVASSMLLSKH